jgi:hypothetical protein
LNTLVRGQSIRGIHHVLLAIPANKMADAPTVTCVLVFLHLVWAVFNTPWVMTWMLESAARHRQPRTNENAENADNAENAENEKNKNES